MNDYPQTRFDKVVWWIKNNRLFAVILLLGTCVVVIGSLTDAITKINNFARGEDSTIMMRAALAKQVEIDPPYYGNSWNGNVRPQMEAYIKSFNFPKNCPGTESAQNLLKMIDERANVDQPTEYFDADNSFRAALDTFRGKVRNFAETGKWSDM